MLAALHSKHFPQKWLAANLLEGPSYRKNLFEYLSDAKKMDVSPGEALKSHRHHIADFDKASRKDCSGGQLPGIIIIANTSEDFSFNIFSDGTSWIAQGKKLAGGAFGLAMNIRKAAQIGWMNDTITPSYMLGHMDGTQVGFTQKDGVTVKEALIPYIPFIASFGSHDEKRGRTKKEVNGLLEGRRKKFIEDYRTAGALISDKDMPCLIHHDPKSDSLSSIYMPKLVHDLKKCVYNVVHEDGGEEEFALWASRMGLDKVDIVKKQILALEGHKQESQYFDKLVQMVSEDKEGCCVDSRCNRFDGSMVKDLGGIFTKKMVQAILSNPMLDEFTDKLHTGCGYISTAIKIHEMGLEVRRRIDMGRGIAKSSGTVAGLTPDMINYVEKNYKQAVKQILEGKTEVNFHFDAFYSILKKIDGEMPGDMYHVLREFLVGARSDTRNTVQHMAKRDILRWDNEKKALIMPAAIAMDELLGPKCPFLFQNRAKKDGREKEYQNQYYVLVTMMVAQAEEDFWHAVMLEKHDEIMAARMAIGTKLGLPKEKITAMPHMKAVIENPATGEVIQIMNRMPGKDPSRGWMETISAIDVRDADTGEPI